MVEPDDEGHGHQHLGGHDRGRLAARGGHLRRLRSSASTATASASRSLAKALAVAQTANPLRWGDALTGGSDQNFLTGGIDEAAIYNQVLSASTIAGHYSLGSTAPPPPSTCAPRC